MVTTEFHVPKELSKALNKALALSRLGAYTAAGMAVVLLVLGGLLVAGTRLGTLAPTSEAQNMLKNRAPVGIALVGSIALIMAQVHFLAAWKERGNRTAGVIVVFVTIANAALVVACIVVFLPLLRDINTSWGFWLFFLWLAVGPIYAWAWLQFSSSSSLRHVSRFSIARDALRDATIVLDKCRLLADTSNGALTAVGRPTLELAHFQEALIQDVKELQFRLADAADYNAILPDADATLARVKNALLSEIQKGRTALGQIETHNQITSEDVSSELTDVYSDARMLGVVQRTDIEAMLHEIEKGAALLDLQVPGIIV